MSDCESTESPVRDEVNYDEAANLQDSDEELLDVSYLS